MSLHSLKDPPVPVCPIASAHGGGGGGSGGKDKIDALGRLMTRILRHMASELNMSMRSDGFVKLSDLLQLSYEDICSYPFKIAYV
ncbi:Phosphotransferase KptA/Tpt [Trema orientale]|uniref:2'-phosphotransferase n=1 Tax=Trema orientale TaxID=63057 RepID=A0A2P5ELE5_TREOI|nr:Phosphotransferase KptA/Tpt [Trema orientale]